MGMGFKKLNFERDRGGGKKECQEICMYKFGELMFYHFCLNTMIFVSNF